MTMTRFKLRPLAAAFAVSLALSGCASLTRTQYEAPAVEQPAAWKHGASAASATTQQTAREQWWKAFNDSRLDALVDEAIRSNSDLAAAAIKLRKARINAGLTESDLLPTPGARVGANYSEPLRGDKSLTRNFSASLSLSWQADLWGKLSHARDAAEWEARATEQDRNAARLALTGDVTNGYWKLAWLNERIAVAEQNLRYAEQTRDITQRKFEAGAVSRLDTLSAEQDIASQRANLSSLTQQREEARTAFALLFDGSPQRVIDEPATLPTAALPAVQAGLPASLLAARPDLQASEMRLRSTLASGDATRASFYPDLSLTGSAGSSSERLRSILSNPVGSLAADIALPFLSFHEMALTKKSAQADYELAVNNFRKTLRSAFGDVENALSAREQYLAQAAELQKSLDAARQIEKINEARYRAGAIPMQTLLDAQRTRRNAEASLADNRYNLLTAQTTLNLALGGQPSGA